MQRYLVTGSGAGLGLAIRNALDARRKTVYEFDRKRGHDVRQPLATFGPPPMDLDCLINCAGVNITGWLDEFSEASWNEVMDINAKGIFTMTRWALPELRRTRGTVLNIVSNAATVPMTCSAAYNASKGAALILTKQLARELTKKDGITVFSISPNKLAGTEMSRDIEEQVVKTRGWTEAFAKEYQQKSLLCGEETNPVVLAEFIFYLLDLKVRHKYLTGCDIPYGA